MLVGPAREKASVEIEDWVSVDADFEADKVGTGIDVVWEG